MFGLESLNISLILVKDCLQVGFFVSWGKAQIVELVSELKDISTLCRVSVNNE